MNFLKVEPEPDTPEYQAYRMVRDLDPKITPTNIGLAIMDHIGLPAGIKIAARAVLTGIKRPTDEHSALLSAQRVLHAFSSYSLIGPIDVIAVVKKATNLQTDSKYPGAPTHPEDIGDERVNAFS